MASAKEIQKLREQAWVGDAVLTLFAREYILGRYGQLDAAAQTRLTSNQFLAAFGEPTQVEAKLGRIYLEGGLDSACAWIQEQLIPLFEKQEQKRELQSTGGRGRKPADAPSL